MKNLKRLLSFEFRKLLRSKSFYVCLGLVLVMSALNVILDRVIEYVTRSVGAENEADSIDISTFLSVTASAWLVKCISSSSFSTIIGIFVTIFVCEDYMQKTVKNVYSIGYTRTEVFFSKTITVFIATLAAFIITLLFNLILGLIVYGEFGNTINFFVYVDQFLAVLAIISLTTLACFIFKKYVFPILILIIGPGVVGIILSIIDTAMTSTDPEPSFQLIDYWISTFESAVARDATTKTLLIVGIGSLVYTLIFLTIAWYINKKHEI